MRFSSALPDGSALHPFGEGAKAGSKSRIRVRWGTKAVGTAFFYALQQSTPLQRYAGQQYAKIGSKKNAEPLRGALFLATYPCFILCPTYLSSGVDS